MSETADICSAETPVELWELDAEESGKDVRCVRPEGHRPPHKGVVTWTDAS